ncbi:MAG: lipopolysaccharide kinase InaA family protein [Verrucomicrobiia bacterium]
MKRPFFGDRLLVSPRYEELFRDLRLRAPSGVTALLGRTIPPKQQRTYVKAVRLGPSGVSGVEAHYKEYTFLRPSWRFWLRPSKALREYRNYGVFVRLGIACADRIACGEERDGLGRLRHAFLLTRTLSSVRPLSDYMKDACPARDNPRSSALRELVFGQVAKMLRRLHRAGFYHGDIHWRNILVEGVGEAPPKVWWIDCPRGGFDWTPLAARRRVKDLAQLLAGSARLCSNTERLRFLKQYSDVRTLGPRDRRLARSVLRFYRAHWQRVPG